VPWAESGTGFTAIFEALMIDGLKGASISTVADHMRLIWNAVAGTIQRAVRRGLSRREALSPTCISVDETFCRKGHGYITVATDQVRGTVLHVADDRKTGSLAEFYALLSEEQKQGIESVCMDNSPSYQHSCGFSFLPSNVIGASERKLHVRWKSLPTFC
tara:strand:- start:799 stop:1278 length:480 start_codon:yes stop_codon:yes gene_type:complete